MQAAVMAEAAVTPAAVEAVEVTLAVVVAAAAARWKATAVGAAAVKLARHRPPHRCAGRACASAPEPSDTQRRLPRDWDC
jgi:hypothetical protein